MFEPTSEEWEVIGPLLIEQRRALLQNLVEQNERMMQLALTIALKDHRIAVLEAALSAAAGDVPN